jgi:hypothetical protein
MDEFEVFSESKLAWSKLFETGEIMLEVLYKTGIFTEWFVTKTGED